MSIDGQLIEQLRKTQSLIFDFDGTLAPNLDLPDMKRQVIALTQAAGVPGAVFADAFIVEIIAQAAAWLELNQGGSKADAYQREAHGLIKAIEMQAAANTAVFSCTTQLLKRWRQHGGLSAIVTRNCRAAVVATYPDTLSRVDVLLARDDVVHLKPDVRHLQQAIAALHSSPERCMMIGDGAMDMAIGKACGTCTVGVLSGSGSTASLLDAGANHVLPDVSFFLQALDSL